LANNRFRTITQFLLFVLAGCAALYGVSYAYYLHHVVNIFCAWLVVLHWSTCSFPFRRLRKDVGESSSSSSSSSSEGPHHHLKRVKKRP
jgi:glycosylphosphatidylinositol deacylase